MECEHCEEEMVEHGPFGYLASHQSGEVLGDVYKCENEKCVENDAFYYTYRNENGELHTGYPC